MAKLYLVGMTQFFFVVFTEEIEVYTTRLQQLISNKLDFGGKM